MMFAHCFQYFEFPSRFIAIIIFICKLFIIISLNLNNLPVSYAATRQIDLDARTIYYRNRPPNPIGHFQFEFQTTNGITTKAAGNEYGFSGVVQYVSSEGIPVTMTYTADADGYHPMGDYIHPIPDYIIRSLEYIRTHPAVDEKSSRSL